MIGGISVDSGSAEENADIDGWTDLEYLRLAMTMAQKKNRICESCGYPTDERYTEDEWDAMGRLCEDCAIGELADDTLDDDIL
jgi:hypothetical protein